MSVELIFSIILGFSLAAAAGFRVFVPLLALSLAAHFNWFPIAESWEWMGSLTAVILLAVATVIEILAYFIPWVDNLLDSMAVPLSAIAGTLIMVATMGDMNPVFTWALAIIAGGGAAAAISGTTSASRLTSSATTGGLGNPVIAATETGAAITVATASMFSPLLGLILVLLFIFGIYKLIARVRRSRK